MFVLICGHGWPADVPRRSLSWSEDQCREYLAQRRWPDGVVCPKCGTLGAYQITRKRTSKNVNRHLYKCRFCRKQFSIRAGTIFEDSKIPLRDWFAAIYIICASKKGVSAHQVHRQLGISYKASWFMCHRVREAMREKGERPLLTGTLEADETYVGGKQRGHWVTRERLWDEYRMGLREKPSHARMEKTPVFGVLQRGGEVRTITLRDVNARTGRDRLLRHIDPKRSRLMTDGSAIYRQIRRHVPHQIINHQKEYVDADAPEVHTQGIENYWSLLKRGLIGTFHHVDAAYLPLYLQEFEYRFNRRRMTDGERFQALLQRPQGRLEWYCRTPQPENPHA